MKAKLEIDKKTLPIYIAFFAEVFFTSIGKKILPSLINPVLLFCITIFLVIYVYSIWRNEDMEKNSIQNKVKLNTNILKGISISLSVITFFCLFIFFRNEPIDINKSDIIPIIQKFYLDRLFNGEFVYNAVDRGTYFWTPNYFPMHWLPFSVSYILGFDHRLLALIILLIAVMYYSFKIINKGGSDSNILLKIILPYLILICMMLNEKIIIGHTVETMISAYYLIFSITILRGNTILKSIGLSSILLSRFSIVLWTPFYIISSFIKDKKNTIILSSYCILIALITFIIPFLIRDPKLLINGFNGFSDVYLLEWKGQQWQSQGDNPYQLFNGLGFACYFYKLWPGELLDKLNAIVIAQLIMNISVVIFSFILMKKFSNKIGIERYQLLTLKIALLLFYSFLVVPYQYLFMVPLFVSISIVSQFNLFKQT